MIQSESPSMILAITLILILNVIKAKEFTQSYDAAQYTTHEGFSIDIKRVGSPEYFFKDWHGQGMTVSVWEQIFPSETSKEFHK